MKNIILFYSNNHAVWCNDLLTENEIFNKMVSVPRELSSDCGYCVSYNCKDDSKVRELLTNSDIEYDRIENI